MTTYLGNKVVYMHKVVVKRSTVRTGKFFIHVDRFTWLSKDGTILSLSSDSLFYNSYRNAVRTLKRYYKIDKIKAKRKNPDFLECTCIRK